MLGALNAHRYIRNFAISKLLYRGSVPYTLLHFAGTFRASLYLVLTVIKNPPTRAKAKFCSCLRKPRCDKLYLIWDLNEQGP